MLDIKERSLELARTITGSTDVYIVIRAAQEIEKYLSTSTTAIEQPSTSFEDFIRYCVIKHPIQGLIKLDPMPYQQDFAERLSRYTADPTEPFVNLTSRQLGNTMMLSLYALWYALTSKKCEVLYVCFNSQVAQDVMKSLVAVQDNLPARFPRIRSYQKFKLETGTESTIKFTTYKTLSTMVGLNDYSLIILDDACFMSHSDEYRINVMIGEQREKRLPVIISSNAGETRGFFYNAWERASPDMKLKQPWSVHPDRDMAWAQDMANQIGEDCFNQQFDCKFVTPELKD